MRVGFGYDVHKLVPERKLILAGVEVPFEKGLLGHSDADVLTHAIMDAMLGAAGLRDIGSQFPSADSGYKNISSLILLDEVNKLVWDKGFVVVNIDAVIVAQEPQLSTFIEDMRGLIRKRLGLNLEQVMVKATTTDGLGFIGRGEGMAAYAVVLVEERQK
jgi:2-C-methyl-D-erythritol 2,4-cyclodiphosphate synthase